MSALGGTQNENEAFPRTQCSPVLAGEVFSVRRQDGGGSSHVFFYSSLLVIQFLHQQILHAEFACALSCKVCIEHQMQILPEKFCIRPPMQIIYKFERSKQELRISPRNGRFASLFHWMWVRVAQFEHFHTSTSDLQCVSRLQNRSTQMVPSLQLSVGSILERQHLTQFQNRLGSQFCLSEWLGKSFYSTCFAEPF